MSASIYKEAILRHDNGVWPLPSYFLSYHLISIIHINNSYGGRGKIWNF